MDHRPPLPKAIYEYRPNVRVQSRPVESALRNQAKGWNLHGACFGSGKVINKIAVLVAEFLNGFESELD